MKNNEVKMIFMLMITSHSSRAAVKYFGNEEVYVLELDRVYPNPKTRRVLAIFSNPNPI